MGETLRARAADFVATLDEVDALVELADECAADERRYAALNKAAVLLLTGKFETFAEAIAEEYVFAVNALAPQPSAIPLTLRLQHTFQALKAVERLQHAHKQADAERAFRALGTLWGTDGPFRALSIDCTFSYGKHGETELRKLFATVGIDDVFAVVLVTSAQERLGDGSDSGAPAPVDFKGTFNSATYIRNNILHEDASPTLTSADVREYRRLFTDFAHGVAAVLAYHLAGVAAACAGCDSRGD